MSTATTTTRTSTGPTEPPPGGRLRINDIARRSGFSAATLRYYEEIGLLPAPERTDAGYRMYGDDTLERLAFIARAKQLGCTLEEIAALGAVWSGGECAPVQDRLRTLVVQKLADTHRQIADLQVLAGELESAAAVLAERRADGPCDDTCGCITQDGPSTPVQFGRFGGGR